MKLVCSITVSAWFCLVTLPIASGVLVPPRAGVRRRGCNLRTTTSTSPGRADSVPEAMVVVVGAVAERAAEGKKAQMRGVYHPEMPLLIIIMMRSRSKANADGALRAGSSGRDRDSAGRAAAALTRELEYVQTERREGAEAIDGGRVQDNAGQRIWRRRRCRCRCRRRWLAVVRCGIRALGGCYRLSWRCEGKWTDWGLGYAATASMGQVKLINQGLQCANTRLRSLNTRRTNRVQSHMSCDQGGYWMHGHVIGLAVRGTTPVLWRCAGSQTPGASLFARDRALHRFPIRAGALGRITIHLERRPRPRRSRACPPHARRNCLPPSLPPPCHPDVCSGHAAARPSTPVSLRLH